MSVAGSLRKLLFIAALLKYTAGRESCPHETEYYGFRVANKCHTCMIVKKDESSMNVTASKEICQNRFKNGYVYPFTVAAMKQMPEEYAMPSALILSGWKVATQPVFQIKFNEEVGHYFAAYFDRVTFRSESIDSVELAITRRWEVHSDHDLKLNHFGYMLLVFGTMDMFPMCSTVYQGFLGVYDPGSAFSCDRPRKNWDVLCCVSDPYRDCLGEAKGSCQHVPKSSRCAMKYIMKIRKVEEKPYGRCVYDGFKWDEQCNCESCSNTEWSIWTKFNATCGDAFRHRYRPPNNEPDMNCVMAGIRGCCSEMEMISWGDCPCTKQKIQCFNGGSCHNVDNKEWRCRCFEGFTGRHCEIKLKHCIDATCLHGGTCIEFMDGFECACPAGYHGKSCQDAEPQYEDPRKNVMIMAPAMIAALAVILLTGTYITKRIIKKRRKQQSWADMFESIRMQLSPRGIQKSAVVTKSMLVEKRQQEETVTQ